MSRVALLLAAGWLSAGLASADPLKIDRTIAKEPAYKTKTPQYGLLAFGSDGKDRVWMVRDGDVLYVDRNGNGDLTEPGEKIAATRRAGRDPEEDGYTFEVGDLSVGGQVHKGLSVSFEPLKRYRSLEKRPEVKAALAKDPKAAVVRLVIDVLVPGIKAGGLGGRVGLMVGPIDLAGVFLFADTPASAPAVHCGGPLEITFFGERPTFRAGRGGELMLVVGTPGVGPGTFAMVRYEDTIPTDVKPIAEITFPPAKAGGPPIKERLVIKDRC